MSAVSCCSDCKKELQTASEKLRGRCNECQKKHSSGSKTASLALVVGGAVIGFVGGYLASWWNTDQNNNEKNPTTKKTNDENLDDDGIGTCPICYDNVVDTSFEPCGHTVCLGCFNDLTSNKCPMCSKCIEKTHKIYLN